MEDICICISRPRETDPAMRVGIMQPMKGPDESGEGKADPTLLLSSDGHLSCPRTSELLVFPLSDSGT